ncbi:MAG: serine hydrolase [Nocardioidaceae bacterium]
MRRRGLLGLVLAATGLVLATAVAPVASVQSDGHETLGRYDRPRDGFAPSGTRLMDATPEQARLDPAPIDAALAAVAAWTRPSGEVRPLFAGAVTLLGHQGRIVTREATGWALRYADGDGTELPRDQWTPMRTDTIFDLASVSKLFTSIVVMQQVEAGRIDLDSPVATYVPEFAENGKRDITIRQLLTHTSGLPAWLPLWRDHPDPVSRVHAALTAKLRTEPGTTYEYSDLNLIGLGVLVERVSGQSLDELVAADITEPLGMADTGYNPDPTQWSRIAATEFQAVPDRGMVRGVVHDENAWSLGGVAGHAGVFSTADDLAVLAQALLSGGTYAGDRILQRSSVEQLITNLNAEFPGDDHGLGFELNQRWYMSGLSSPRTAGHTGYTGTSLVIDFPSRSFAILLSNRVHPSRSWGSNNPARRAVAQALAMSMAVRPHCGPDAWFSGTVNASKATGGGRLGFGMFIDTEETDVFSLATSADGGATWTPLPFAVRDRGEVTLTEGSYSHSGDRRWVEVRADLAAGEQLLRLAYTTDSDYTGRGVYIDAIRAVSGGRVLLDGERHPEAFTADGWQLARR